MRATRRLTATTTSLTLARSWASGSRTTSLPVLIGAGGQATPFPVDQAVWWCTSGAPVSEPVC